MQRFRVLTDCSGLLAGALLLITASAIAAAQTNNGFDLSDALIPAADIHWGGVPRDGIPSIDHPKFIIAPDATFLRDQDRVLGVHRNGVAKAYPIRILDRHEVVNDRFLEERIVVTYCPLCYSGMSFSIAADSVAKTFGVSGLLYNSDVLLYDRETESLWSQIMSQAVGGPLRGLEITPVVTAHTTWRDWRARFPETLVLSTETGFAMQYKNSPYDEYQRSRQTMFPVQNRSRQYSNKELVLGVSIEDKFKAYPFKELRRHDLASFDDTFAGTTLTIKWDESEQFATAFNSDGDEIATVIVYWFAWFAFHTDTAVFQASSD